MAVNLIRKNNGVGITAYQDAVMFHLAKGENGVIPDVHDEFEANYNSTSKILTIASGMGMAYGRQFEIVPGETIEFDFSTLSGTRYIVIYAEIDLRDPTNEVAILKSSYASTAYPVIDAGDNLIDVPSGIHRMVLYHVLKTGESATIETKFTKLQNDKIKNALLADDAKLINGVKVSHNNTDNEVEVLISGKPTEIVERKQLVFSSPNGQLLDYQNTELTTTVALQEGDCIEVVYAYGSSNKKIVVRDWVIAPSYTIGGASIYLVNTRQHVFESQTMSRRTFSTGIQVSGTTWTYYEGSSVTEILNTNNTYEINLLLLYRGVVQTTPPPSGITIYKIFKIIGGAS